MVKIKDEAIKQYEVGSIEYDGILWNMKWLENWNEIKIESELD